MDDDIIAAAITAAAELTELALEDGDTSLDSIETTFTDLYNRILAVALESVYEDEEEEDDEDEEKDEDEDEEAAPEEDDASA